MEGVEMEIVNEFEGVIIDFEECVYSSVGSLANVARWSTEDFYPCEDTLKWHFHI